MTDVDAALVQQIFDVPQRQGEAYVEHHRQADDLAARPRVLEGVVFRHQKMLRDHPAPLNRNPSDKAERAPCRSRSYIF